LRLHGRTPFLRDRALQDRLDLGLKRIGRHAGDDGRADFGCDIHSTPVAIEIDGRHGGIRGSAERQIEEEVGEHQALTLRDLL